MRLFALSVLVVALVTNVARADAPAFEQAQAAFEEGKRLAKEGDYARACGMLEKSQRLAPASGTLLNLADCYEHLGRTATAWATFRAAAAAAHLSDNREREKEATARAATLEPRLGKLRIAVKPEARVDGLVVRRNDVLVDRSLWDVAVPVDPGRHIVKAQAPGHTTFEQPIDVPAASGEVEVTIESLAALPTKKKPPPPPTPDGTRQRIIGLVIGAVGVAAIGVAIGFGVDALVKNAASNDAGCSENLCPPEGLELRNRALTEAHLSTGLMVAGLVNVAAGLIVFFTAPADEERTLGVRW